MSFEMTDLPEPLIAEASNAWQRILERAGEVLAGQLQDRKSVV